ncbi:REP-associated tyrosine transposase [Simiduia agarivorans]|uniref:Transposase n=1 Tax=Simiduia agarivorans (strain DSM 21679 / JCM 13881 / BCRC 17597 / SA1) TaxID=1117647 RepID=K4KMC1_SIMAS|nr:transposase [Simiduia agarivorans]AFU99223.1 transposase [Simiduia agarivorans SA1 = DSM 21679]
MSNYRRYWQPGGTYFFTVNANRTTRAINLIHHADLLREVVADVRSRHPFALHAWVLLPDHLHWVASLPEGVSDFSSRWRLIKANFSRALPKLEPLSSRAVKRGERGIWQHRYWEHCIRDEQDFAAHVDYVHMNPVKHGLVEHVRDWPHSSFHAWVERGRYPEDWGG